MSEAAFTKALLDPSRPAPSGLIGPSGAPAGKRFDVYRNNVAVGLTDALATAFPVVQKLVGDEFFRAMSGVYLRIHQPQTRMMKDYGETFPGFLARFDPVAHLRYLPDVARLERARIRAYHAADAAPLTAEALAALSTEALMTARLVFHPAVQVVASDWPILSIWRHNAENGPKPAAAAQTVLVTRPTFDPQMYLLPERGATFIRALRDGANLSLALAETGPNFDLTTALSALMAGGALKRIDP